MRTPAVLEPRAPRGASDASDASAASAASAATRWPSHSGHHTGTPAGGSAAEGTNGSRGGGHERLARRRDSRGGGHEQFARRRECGRAKGVREGGGSAGGHRGVREGAASRTSGTPSSAVRRVVPQPPSTRETRARGASLSSASAARAHSRGWRPAGRGTHTHTKCGRRVVCALTDGPTLDDERRPPAAHRRPCQRRRHARHTTVQRVVEVGVLAVPGRAAPIV